MDRNEELISVIIPVYKTENLLNRCVFSVVHQSYKNMEIILVDDGSPDNCPNLCDEWGKKDKRIRVFHQKNMGLSGARNTGINNARGNYILFVDSDDWISLNMIEKLYYSMIDMQSDMAICQFIKVKCNGDLQYSANAYLEDEIQTAGQNLSLLLEDISVTSHVWRRLIRTSFLCQNFFPLGKNFEDIATIPDITYKCKKILLLHDPLYYYYINESGITGLQTLSSIENNCEYSLAFAEKMRQWYPEKTKEIEEYVINRLIIIWKDLVFNYKGDRNREWQQICREVKKRLRVCDSKCISNRRTTIKYVLINFLPNFIAERMRRNKCIEIMRYMVNKCTSIQREIQAWKVAKENRVDKNIWLFSVPDYGNLGDQAIYRAELSFLKNFFPDYQVISIPVSSIGQQTIWLYKRIVRTADLIMIQGGGNFGSLYPYIHRKQEAVIRTFKTNPIYVFPQTFLYENGADKLLQRTQKLYLKRTNLHLFVREKFSYDFVKEYFQKTEVYLMPDMALAMENEKKSEMYARQGVLMCLRTDFEKTLSRNEYEEIVGLLENRFQHIEEQDTDLHLDMPFEMAEKELKKFLKKMCQSELVITDRLHGMIFAAVTQTPCVAISSYSHKMSGVYEWIRSINYIELINNIEEFNLAMDRVLLEKNRKYQVDIVTEKIKEMSEIIRGRK